MFLGFVRSISKRAPQLTPARLGPQRIDFSVADGVLPQPGELLCCAHSRPAAAQPKGLAGGSRKSFFYTSLLSLLSGFQVAREGEFVMPQSGTVDFWAVGTDCCDKASRREACGSKQLAREFTCGEAWVVWTCVGSEQAIRRP